MRRRCVRRNPELFHRGRHHGLSHLTTTVRQGDGEGLKNTVKRSGMNKMLLDEPLRHLALDLEDFGRNGGDHVAVAVGVNAHVRKGLECGAKVESDCLKKLIEMVCRHRLTTPPLGRGNVFCALISKDTGFQPVVHGRVGSFVLGLDQAAAVFTPPVVLVAEELELAPVGRRAGHAVHIRPQVKVRLDAFRASWHSQGHV